MKEAKEAYRRMVNSIPEEIRMSVDLSFDISNRIASLMEERNISTKQLAEALGKRTSEITKWLSGQHNFSLRTIAKLSTFFKEPIITVLQERKQKSTDSLKMIND